MAKREGKTISFYTDKDTAEKLEKKADADSRSVSNYLTLLLKELWGKEEGEKEQADG